jgi:cobalt/nickel transport system ATP-binding protein
MMPPQATQPLFSLEKVFYTYGNWPALKDLDLVLTPEEPVVILGANGCGKSTLLKLLDGLIFPTSGQIQAFGRELTERVLETDGFRRFFRERVGMVFQNADLQLFCPTVFDEVAFGPLQLDLGKGEVQIRVEETLNLLGLWEIRKRSPLELSGGEKRKVSLASVLSLNPQVLLLDEPTSGLDPRSQVELVEILTQLIGAGKTLITATHDLSIAEDIAGRILVMGEDHTLAAAGAPGQILEDTKLLLRVNLIHEHPHRHGDLIHHHGHAHHFTHDHTH